MNFQKFVAWEKTPTPYHQVDAQDSSSSSKTGSLAEEESEVFLKAQDTESEADMTVFPIEVPHSVRNVLNKIEIAQLERAKKDISKKLVHIKEKVNRVCERYKKDDAFDSDLEREYLRTATWEEKSRRSNLLDELTDALDQTAFKKKELETVLESLKAWSEMMRTIELQEKVIPSEDWIEDAEESLQKRFHAIQENILYLIKMCCPLLHEREKLRRKSSVKAGVFKAWRDKVAEKTQLAEPMTADQMVEDEVRTFALTHEVNEMIQELAHLSIFNKAEVNAVKYIASMVANLAKAFGLLSRQCRSLKFKLEVGSAESRKQDPQVTSLQRELRTIIEKKAALEKQVQNAEERCKVLLTTNEAMQKELRSAHDRAQLTRTSASFTRPPFSKVPEEQEKSEVDVEKDVSKAISVRQLPKHQPSPSRVPGTETEESGGLRETRKLKYESEDGDTVDSMTKSQTFLAQDSEIKTVMKVQEKEAAPQVAPQKSPEETAHLGGKTGLKFPVEKVVESIQKSKKDRVPIAPQDSKLLEKIKFQQSQLVAAKSVTESHLSQSSRASSQDSFQEITPEVEPSPQSSVQSVLTPSIKEEEAQLPSTEWDGQSTEQKPSLKSSVQKVVDAIKFQKRVKFHGGISTPDSSKKLDAELPEGSPLRKLLTMIAEDVDSESEDAAMMQAQTQQAGRLKEKEEVKGSRSILEERPTDISGKEAEKREQARIIRSGIHDFGAQLQEIAREEGDVIDEETIKELFENLDIPSEEDVSGQMYESLPEDKLAKAPVASKRLSKSRESTDEASSGQDVMSAMQEFQASILACIEDKLEKLKKFPSESLERPEKSKPTNPQFQRLYQAIDRKLDECFSAMKHKYRGAMMRRRFSSQGSEEEEKESTLSLSPQESSVSSLSLPEEGGEQQMALRHRKLSKQRLKDLRKVQPVFQDQQKQREEREDSSRYPHPSGEKLLHLPDAVLRVLEEKQEAKEPQLAEVQSLLKSESEQGIWFLRLQERLEWEKGRLQEEQSRLQDERLRLDDEEQYLGHWQHLFEMQTEQWNLRQQQQEEQELIWNTQLDYWQQLKQEHEEQQRYWWLQQEQHQERLCQLQEELQKLQRQYEQQLLLQKEQTEEQGRWDRLQAWREEQLRAWQEEDEEREKQRSQWQQQLADHEKQLQAWQQEKEEQELQYKMWQETQRQEMQAQEQLWQQRSQQQQQHWQRQVKRHQIQQRKQRTQLQKVQERQKQISTEEKILAPQLKMLSTGVQGGVAKEFQWQEPREASPVKLESPTHKVKVRPTARVDHLPATRKTGPLPATPHLSPEPSGEYLDSFDLDSTLLSKQFPSSPAPGITERRYSINVEAQRKNLELLEEANQKAGLASDLYIQAKETITQALHSNVERLALLFRKYITFCRLQEIRRTLTARLDAAKNDKDGATMKKMYTLVERLDAYQKKVLGKWTSGQKVVEKKRRHTIENMTVLFDQLHSRHSLQLSPPCPLMIKAASIPKETQYLPQIGPVYPTPKVYRSPLFAMKKPIAFSAIVRDEGSTQIESLWQTGITELSIPLGPKTPVSLLWSQTCGFPDIPRLLELDITSLRNKPLQEIKTRVQSIPRWKISEYKFMHL